MDRGAWWATVHRITKSQMPLKWFNTHACICYPLFLDLALLLSFCLPAHLKSTSSCFSPHFYLFHFLCLPWWLSTWFSNVFYQGFRHNSCVCMLSHSVSHVQLFVTPWTVAHQAPLSMGFSKQECWSGLSFNTYFPFIPAFSKSFIILAPSPLPSSPASELLQVSFWLLFTDSASSNYTSLPDCSYKDSLFWCSLPIYRAASLISVCVALPSLVQEATRPWLNTIFIPEMHSLAFKPLTLLAVSCPSFLSTYTLLT